MLDDGTGRRLVELLDTLQGCIRVGDVVIRKLLALELGCRCDTGLTDAGLGKEGGALVGVFPVTHGLLALKLEIERARVGQGLATLQPSSQIVGNGAIVAGCVFEALDR